MGAMYSFSIAGYRYATAFWAGQVAGTLYAALNQTLSVAQSSLSPLNVPKPRRFGAINRLFHIIHKIGVLMEDVFNDVLLALLPCDALEVDLQGRGIFTGLNIPPLRRGAVPFHSAIG
jgi:hypothetical protein